ncbi:MAG: BatA and WFA domain-containing protein [Acidobacteria bacterium]|nr:BatA and WFA domain-containing protein [Acidobacteriota bacterium]
MGLLSPWFLLGALAVGVPIWLHLIRHEQAIRIPFSSLMFFRRIPRKSVSRQRLKYLLLLAARILVILLIVLAFAHPYFPGAARLFSGGADGKYVVVLLDTSLSMQHGDRWQRALAAARDEIAGLGEQDQAQIVTFSSDSKILNRPSSDKAALRAVLDGVEIPTASTTSYAQAFRAVERIAEDAGRPLSVVLISDLQKSGVGQQQHRLQAPLAEPPKLVDVAGETSPNWTVEGIRSRRVIYQGSYPDRLLVQIRGFDSPAASKTVALSVSGKLIQSKTVPVPASGIATVAFEGFDVPTGNNRGEIRITPSDDLAVDDAFYFTLERRNPNRILFIQDGRENRELYYFRTALAAEPDSPFLIEARTPTQAASLDLGNYAMVMLSNVANLPGSLASNLASFVQAGGGAFFTMGTRFPAPSLENQLSELWPGKSIAKQVMTRDGDRLILIGEFDEQHPLFREFQQAGAESLRSAEIYAYVRVQPQGEVLLRFANGDPALVEKQYGRGRVLLFTSSFDNVWSDFPLHPVFIPLVHQLVRYTTQLPDEPAAHSIPTTVSLNDYAAGRQETARAGRWNVIGPDGKREVPLAEELRPDFLVLRQPGFYEVRREASSHLIAANTDPRESDLTPLSPEDRAFWTASYQEGQEATGSLAGPEVAQRQNVWWYVLLLALLVAVAEAYLANQYLGTRKTTISPGKTQGESYAG